LQAAACRVTTAHSSGGLRERIDPDRPAARRRWSQPGARSGAAFARAALGTPRSRRSGRHPPRPPPRSPRDRRLAAARLGQQPRVFARLPAFASLPGRGRARTPAVARPVGGARGHPGPVLRRHRDAIRPPPRRVGRLRRTRAPRSAVAVVPSHPKRRRANCG